MQKSPKYTPISQLSRTFMTILIALSTLITGCNLESETNDSPQTGTFVDSPVMGLTYSTPTYAGTTNQAGEFQYKAGENVTFSVGHIALPTVTANAEMTPLTLFQTDDLQNRQVANLLSLLQTLDTDSNPNNGITLPETLNMTTSGLQVDFDALNFSQQVKPIVANTRINDGKLVPYENAIQHFRGSLPYQSSDINGNWLFQNLKTPRQNTFNPSDFNLTLEHANVTDSGILSTSSIFPANDNEFLYPIEPSNLSLDVNSLRPGELRDQGSRFDFAFLNRTKDVAFGLDLDSNHQTFSALVKMPFNAQLDAFQGNWLGFELNTPAMNQGDTTQFGFARHQLTIENNGKAQQITLGNPQSTPDAQALMFSLIRSTTTDVVLLKSGSQNFAMNASLSLLLTPQTTSTQQKFSIYLKQAQNYQQSDLQGAWYGGKITVPNTNEDDANLFSQEIVNLVVDEQGQLKARDVNTQLYIDMNDLFIRLNETGQFSTSPPLNYPAFWLMDETKSVIAIIANESPKTISLTLLLKQMAM